MTKPGVGYTGVPRHLAALRTRVANVSRDSNVLQQRLEVLIASVVATQLLSDAVVKGGIALKLRGGDRATRFTTVVDVARPAAVSIDEFIDSLRSRSNDGWAGFTARIIEGRRARAPKAVPVGYVMRPYELKLAYRGRSFKTVTFEVGHDEISSMASPAEWRMSPDIVDLFQRLDMPDLATAVRLVNDLIAAADAASEDG